MHDGENYAEAMHFRAVQDGLSTVRMNQHDGKGMIDRCTLHTYT